MLEGNSLTPGLLTGLKLKGEKVVLVPPKTASVEDTHRALVESNELHRTYLSWANTGMSLESVRQNMQVAQKNFDAFQGELRFMVLNTQDQVVGCVGLKIESPAIPYYEIGYWVRQGHQGQGLMTEAVGLVVNFAQEVLGAKRIDMKMSDSNVRSWKLAERVGFKLEARLKNTRLSPSNTLDHTRIYAWVSDG